MKYFFEKILLGKNWSTNTLVTVDGKGTITSIEPNTSKKSDETLIKGLAIPGFQNAHSHSFQYAMAGLAEIHQLTDTPDDFWSWRDAMYKLALSLNPDEFEAIATMLYAEMLRHGYTNVAEFHYLHHDKNGQQYDSISEMGERLISAAKKTGMNITLVPIFYQMGGFGKKANDGQKRFLSNSIDAYLNLFEASKKACTNYSGANIAIGFHSMRGVRPEDIIELSKSGPQDIPYHIHISEQLKEIDDCVEYLGKRPVEWLLDNVEVNKNWHLVHATHLTPIETRNLAKTGSSVVLCPTTEGNLGDGIFPLRDYQELNGRWSIGTDSHIGINPLEELRLLDYGQRLITHKRNTFNSKSEGNSGDFSFKMALENGRRAMGNFETEFFKIGEPLNVNILESNSPFASTTSDKSLLTSLIYTNDSSNSKTTISNGKIVVENGQHIHYNSILNAFNKVISKIGNR